MFLDLLKQLLDYNGVEPPEIKTLMREFDESVQVYFIKSFVMNKGNLTNHLLFKSISHNNIDSLMSGGSDSNNRRDMVVLDMHKYVQWLSDGLGYSESDTTFEERNDTCKV